ncbi:MAG: flagellar basal body L-ring protein FlgH [bacterium]|nr:flagellar basal body L-ring protein FlgH [bacterium]
MKRSEKFYFILILAITLTVWVKAKATDAESLWLKGEQESLYVDSKAKKKGDIITVIITEASQASHKSVTKRAKDISLNGAPDAAKAGSKNLLSFLPFTGAKAKSSFSGAGATTRTGLLNAMITVNITEVMANGNLVIDGKRRLRVNGDEEEISVSGIIRPQDITPQNTVLSTCISNAHIRYKGEAELTDKERPGVIGRITNKIANIFF